MTLLDFLKMMRKGLLGEKASQGKKGSVKERDLWRSSKQSTGLVQRFLRCILPATPEHTLHDSDHPP